MTREGAIFFDEGPGYLFIKTLGNGVDGSASLVRNTNNGLLYVRKETFKLSQNSCSNDPRCPPREAEVAHAVGHLPGVYQARGWSKWKVRGQLRYQPSQVMSVTYWGFCDLGTIPGFGAKQQVIPEIYVCYWLRKMLSTLVDVHHAGVVHNDPHFGNWLLQRREDHPIPDIVLADFGRANFKEELTPESWLASCTGDFGLLMECVRGLLGLDLRQGILRRGNRSQCQCSSQLIRILQAFIDVLQNVPRCMSMLHKTAQAVRQALNEHMDGTLIPSNRFSTLRAPEEFSELATVTKSIMEKRAFKQYKVAIVDLASRGRQGRITIPRSPNELCPVMNILSEGHYPQEDRNGGRYIIQVLG